jgi:multidrug efflux pump subunit AcrA (membrane-fusion protein)
MQMLVQTVANLGEDLNYPASDESPRAPQLEQSLDQYLEQSPARRLDVLLLRSSTSPGSASIDAPPPGSAFPDAALMLESFQQTAREPDAMRHLDRLRPHCATALGQRLRSEQRPLHRTSLWLARWNDPARRLRIPLALLAIAALVITLRAVQIELTIPARGTLQPTEQHDLFASSDGIVRSLHVAHGERVGSGQLLVTLEDPALELRASEVAGQLRTAQQQLQTVRAQRLSPATAAQDSLEDLQLATHQQQLLLQIAGLQLQQQIVARQRDQLQIRSPIDGTVVSWEVDRQLRNRPVRRGHRLLSVSEPDGPWRLELWVGDRDIAHVLAHREQLAKSPQEVEFLLATDSRRTYRAVLADVSLVTQQNQQPEVRVTANLPAEQTLVKRAGATVRAKIHCGKRSAAYVWGRSLYDSLRTWWF